MFGIRLWKKWIIWTFSSIKNGFHTALKTCSCSLLTHTHTHTHTLSLIRTHSLTLLSTPSLTCGFSSLFLYIHAYTYTYIYRTKGIANNNEQFVLRLVKLLTQHYSTLEEHHLFNSIIKQIFTQLFYMMSTSALNKMLTTPELCRASRYQLTSTTNMENIFWKRTEKRYILLPKTNVVWWLRNSEHMHSRWCSLI
jgi:hypothetical protein